jgi:wyosine [tRNA(Phe)-imidazoG37] synthetase (radical SAM superfamily)
VLSRRLGLSLGINVIPRKTCTLDCVYCQCGKTTQKTLERRSFFRIGDIIAGVGNAIRRARSAGRRLAIDYLTFSGEGEPTLNKDIGTIIRRLKREFRIPVAVITNSTLMPDPQVRRDLLAADLVVPSLDAADQRTFAGIDRCHRDLKVADIIEGLKQFRRQYRGQVWLEIMLVKGVNDSVEHVVALRRLAHEIRPDRVQLNTVVRPPAEKSARPMSHDDLVQIQCLFGPNTDIATDKPQTPNPKSQTRGGTAVGNRQSEVARRILATVHGRPVTSADLVRALGVNRCEVNAALPRLVAQRRVRRVRYSGKTYYEPA